jgi:signal transduction histidine kinase
MIFKNKSRLFAACRTVLILSGLAGAYKLYERFEDLGDESEYILNIQTKAGDLLNLLLAAKPAGQAETFHTRYSALGRAIGARDSVSAVNTGALREIRAQYYDIARAAEEFPAPEPGKAAAGGASVRERTARIGVLALGAAKRGLEARNLLLEQTALAYLSLFLLLLLAEGIQHYMVNAPFLSGFDGLKSRLARIAAPFRAGAAALGETEELTASAEVLERTLEASMLARLKLARETTVRLGKMKAQTRTLELTRRKVMALVEDLDEARTELQREKKALKETGVKLTRSNKELEQFAYVASHDLKEPLRIVTSFSGLLSKRYATGLDKDARDFIHYIDEGANRATELVNALFNYSRVTYSAKEFAQVDCVIALKKAMFNMKMTLDERKALVSFGDLPSVRGDEFQLIQLFQNLLSNALKFNTAPAPEIRVSALKNADEWVLKFADNGIGIPAEHFERIFMIFQRLHTVDKYPGAGIGLALCKKIAENHGGRIWVESKAGEGSAFFIAFPAAAAAPEPARV